MVTEYGTIDKVSLQLCLSGNKLTGIYVCRIPSFPPLGWPPASEEQLWGRPYLLLLLLVTDIESGRERGGDAFFSTPLHPISTMHHSCVKRRRKRKALWVLPPSSSSSVFFLLLGVAVRGFEMWRLFVCGEVVCPNEPIPGTVHCNKKSFLTGLLKKQAYLMLCDKVFLKVGQTSQKMCLLNMERFIANVKKGHCPMERRGKEKPKAIIPPFWEQQIPIFNWQNENLVDKTRTTPILEMPPKLVVKTSRLFFHHCQNSHQIT